MATAGKGARKGPPRIYGDWAPPQGMGAVKEDAPARERESESCGGTAHILPAERAKATFETIKLTHAVDGGPKNTFRRRWLWSEGDQFDNSGNYTLSREDLVAQHAERFLKIHRSYAEKGFSPSMWDITVMGNASRNSGAFALHYGAFCPTLLSQCNQEQMMEWLLPAYRMDIVGCLAQTELGHGSNVRGLQTTATYDPTTQEFVLDTPTLKALKWWPGGLGKTATHCALYAQLVVGGHEYGLHVFLLQLRDEHHRPLPGIEVGEIGPKVGDNCTETGFLRLTGVRIPRTWMMMKNQYVTPEGKYVKVERKGDAKGKVMYSTMLQIRAGLVLGAGYRLAQGVTIVSRYSCVRRQGFVDTTSSDGRLAEENAIIDYQNQLYRILKQLAISYAFVFTGKEMSGKIHDVVSALTASAGDEGPADASLPRMAGGASKTGASDGDLSALPEMHATSAGLKALCTFTAAEGLEECRKCCGGHGVMLASGVAQFAVDYVTYCTAEGDRIILELQSARFLVKSLRQARAGEPLSGACEYLKPLKDASFDVLAQRCAAAPTSAAMQEMETLLQAFKYRAMATVVEVGTRLHSLQHGSAEAAPVPFDKAWNACAVDLVHASRVHCYYVILQSFASQAAAVDDASTRAALLRLCKLYALQNVQEHAGDFVGFMSARQLAAVRGAVRDLLSALRPDVIALTDAFEFPVNVLNSALGRRDGRVYEALYESARTSPLNATGLDVPFKGYKHLEPWLDKEFIRDHAALQHCSGPRAKL